MRDADVARARELRFQWPLADWDTEALADRWLFTPLGKWVARLLLHTTVRPNHVSFAGLVSGAIAGICYGVGSHSTIVAAGLFLLLSVVFDAADGELARARRQTSETGKLFDNVADSVKTGSVVLGIAVGMQIAGTWGPLEPPFGLPMPVGIWGLGVLAGASLILQVTTRNGFVSLYRLHAKGQLDTSYARMDAVQVELAEMRARGGFWLERAVVGFLLAFTRPAHRKPDDAAPPPDAAYADRLLPWIRAWTFYGGATQLGALALASLCGAPLWGLLVISVPANLVYVPLLVATRHAHRLAARAA
ncbi:MAG: CDP-alcohol phosphatidyltransferase family protein [Deltaproteobacteria bacterium]|nr:CDP-alcohol phosphatidyltransferase family protein [Deltaproteobacteria bacterium]